MCHQVQEASDLNDLILESLPGESMESIASDALPVDSHVLPEIVASLAIGGNNMCIIIY